MIFLELNPQAQALNEAISKDSESVFGLLSKKGKAIFFPKKGILAQAADAKTKKINASIGMALEDDGSPLCLDAVSSLLALPTKDAFTYAPSHGKKELREKWLEFLREKNPSLKEKTSLPVVTNALTHGLSLSGYLFLDPGQKLVVPEPFWGNYKLVFQNGFNAEIDSFPLFDGKKFNLKALEEKLSQPGEKKALLLNFPNNPTGYTPTEPEAEAIALAIKEAAEGGKKALALVDDAYFGMVYEQGLFKESLFSKLAGLHENVLAVKIDGATKEDYAWGFRTGFLTFSVKGGTSELYSALEDKASGAIRGNISNASHLSQSLLLKAYSDPGYLGQKAQKHETLKRRYEKIKQLLQKNSLYRGFFEALPFNSGYFMCLKLKGLKAENVRQRLLRDYGTGIIALKGGLLRIAFSSTPYSLIEELFENIYKACRDEKKGL